MNFRSVNLRSLGAGALIFGATLLAYLPAMRGGFLWDDDAHVTQGGSAVRRRTETHLVRGGRDPAVLSAAAHGVLGGAPAVGRRGGGLPSDRTSCCTRPRPAWWWRWCGGSRCRGRGWRVSSLPCIRCAWSRWRGFRSKRTRSRPSSTWARRSSTCVSTRTAGARGIGWRWACLCWRC